MLIKSHLLSYVKDGSSCDKYEFLARTYTQDSFCLLCADCISPSTFSNCPLHNPLREWLKWVNRNIILHIGDITMSENRLGVLLRIATSMLNKVPNVDDITKVEVHSNLTYNVWREYRSIRCEGLPF